MGRKDILLSAYLNRADVMADLYNAVVYHGRQVIKPWQLADVQKGFSEPLQERFGKKRRVARERDAAKLLCREGYCILLAVENQDMMHFGMPLRCAGYDLGDLLKQQRRIRERYRQDGGLKRGAEYLSGMKATDRLIPTVTLVLYYGEEDWTAAKRLRELFDLGAVDDPLEKLLEDYRLHLVKLAELDERKLRSGLRELTGMMKRRNSAQEMREYCRENAARFDNLDEDAYDLICAMLRLKRLEREKEHYRDEKREAYQMCKAFDDMMKMEKKAGIAIGEKCGEKRGEKNGKRLGEERLGALVSRLLRDGRMADVAAAAGNAGMRARLYREYGI